MDLKKLDVKKNEIKLGGKYLLKERLGGGSFGQTFCAINQDNQARVAAKLEKRSPNATLVREAKAISDMRGEPGFPSLYDYGKEENYNYIIISLLGWNLEKLFKACNHRFSLKTVLMIADQMLSRIETLHNKNYLHRDIKPENFCIGKNSSGKIVYMIDFGLAKCYKDATGKHISFKDNKGLVGTARYASLNTHNGQEQSRRDDLEAIGYTLVYFLLGKLPWQNLKVEEKYKKYQKIAELKTKIPLEQLCQGLPTQFITYLNYTRNLQFTENPDYKYLKKLFRTLFIENGYDFDYNYDWIDVFKTQYSVDTTITPHVRAGRDDESKEYNVAIAESKAHLKGELNASPQVKHMKNLQDKHQISPNPTSRYPSSSKPILSDDNRNIDLTEEDVKPNPVHRMSAKLTTYPKIMGNVGTNEFTNGETHRETSPNKKKTIVPESLWKNMSINSIESSKDIDLNLAKGEYEDEIPAEMVAGTSMKTQVGMVKQFPTKKQITMFGESEEAIMVNTNRDDPPTTDKFLRGKTKTFVVSNQKETKRSPFASASLVDTRRKFSEQLSTKQIEGREIAEGDLNESSICEWEEDGINLDHMINEKRFFVNNKYH